MSEMDWKGKRPAAAMRDWAQGYAEVVLSAGQRAIDHHVDTGECLFCSTDGDGRHEHHCELGKFFGVSDRVAPAPTVDDGSIPMPADFVRESDLQRCEAAASLQARATRYLAQDATTWPTEFLLHEQQHPRPEMFARATRVAVELDEARECAPDNLSRVMFSPSPDKRPGAWRIEVSSKPNGPWSGKEWYVSSNELFDAWDRAVST